MTEHDIQVQIVSYLRYTNVFCFAVPNGFYYKEKNLGKKFGYIKRRKAEGLTAGVADIIVLKKEGKAIFLEVKTKIGTQEKSQKEFEQRVKELGFEYYLVRSLEDVKDSLAL